MNRNVLPLLIASAAVVAAPGSFAQENLKSGFYLGAGYGSVTVPDAEEFEFSDADNGLLQLGYKITENFSVEVQYSSSVNDASASFDMEGDITAAVKAELRDQGYSNAVINDLRSVTVDTRNTIDFAVDTLALFGAYRTSGDLYAKFKAGVVTTEITPSASTSGTMTISSFSTGTKTENINNSDFQDGFDGAVDSEQETEFSAGVGVGYNFTQSLNLELEYVSLSDDVDLYSLSVNFAI